MNNLFKKALAAMAAASMVFGAVGCASETPKNDAENATVSFTDAQELMLKVWQEESDEDKPAVFGGAGDNISENEPMALNLSDAELLENTFTVPAELIDDSDSASSVMNAMMANNFTASAWQLKNGTDAAAVAKAMSEKVAGNQWICSFPEVYYILQSGNYLVLVYGLNDFVDPFVKAFETVCTDSKVLYNEPIA